MSLFFKGFPPICPYFLGFRVGKYEKGDKLASQPATVLVMHCKLIWN